MQPHFVTNTDSSVCTLHCTSSSKILIVEDDAGARELLYCLLTSEGYEVMAVEDGEACLNLYPQFQPDLVLMDAIIPKIGGFDCCRAIRAQTDRPQAQIIMFTSRDDDEAVNESIAAGASNYLTKPIRPAVLKQQIRQFLQQSKSQYQLEIAQQELQQQLQEQNTQVEVKSEKLQDAIAKIQEFEQLKERLITHLSHNIRNPLNIILTASELLKLQLPEVDSEQAKHFHLIDESIDTITGVLEILNTFEQLTSRERQLHLAPTNLTELCQSVVKQWQPILSSRHQLVFMQCGMEVPFVNLDIASIRQALNELISNAIRFSPFGGEIRVQLHWLTDSFLLSVKDQGIGIPAAERTQVFTAFYRASNANSIQGTPGVGLGLAIVQQVIELHQGSIVLKSELDQGTVAMLYLPLSRS